MNNLSVYKDNFRKRAGAIVLTVMVAVTSFGINDCARHPKHTSNVYTVKKTEQQIHQEDDCHITKYGRVFGKIDKVDEKYAYYDRVVDLNTISDSLPNSIFTDLKNMKDYVYTVREGGFVNHLFVKNKTKSFMLDDIDYDVYTTAAFRRYGNFILPDAYKWAENIITPGSNEKDIDEVIRLEELSSISGNKYLLYDYVMVARNDISKSFVNEEYIEQYGMPQSIKEGDFIRYKALFYVNDNNLILLACKQSGIGSNCNNVKDENVGNFEEIIKPISILDQDRKKQKFNNNDEFIKYILKRKH